MGRFRIRLGEAEIEYEGEDSTSKYQAALDWVSETPEHERIKTPAKSEKQNHIEEKNSKRGGIRSPVVSPKIDELIEGGWFDSHRSIDDTVTELKRLVVPGTNKESVKQGLNRRVGKTLATVMDDGVQVFWAAKKSGKEKE